MVCCTATSVSIEMAVPAAGLVGRWLAACGKNESSMVYHHRAGITTSVYIG